MFDVEQSFRTSMVVQHTRLSEAAAALKKALASGVLDPDQLKSLSDQLGDLVEKEENEVEQPAQQIASTVRLLARADTFVKLAQQQAALAGMLRRFSDQTNALTRLQQMELQELAHQQRQIQGALHELLGQLPELAGQLPPDAEYNPLRQDVQSFLQAVAEAGIERDLTNAADALDEPNGLTGHALALVAAEKMDKLILHCRGMPPEGRQIHTARFQPRLSKPGIGNTVEQILAALGAGNGQNGRDGYALFNEAVALYGPNVELAGDQAGGRGNDGGKEGTRVSQVAGDARDSGAPAAGTPRPRQVADRK